SFQCLCGKQLANIVLFQGTFLNRRMRYCSFLPSKMCYRLKHKFAEKKVARGVGSGCKLRNKLRKLLLHFPRSYANLQNAHAKIDDRQYLIFVGKVLSSR
ncbi:hypothetical protein glysoja_043019, partial [Glycine soja]